MLPLISLLFFHYHLAVSVTFKTSIVTDNASVNIEATSFAFSAQRRYWFTSTATNIRLT